MGREKAAARISRSIDLDRAHASLCPSSAPPGELSHLNLTTVCHYTTTGRFRTLSWRCGSPQAIVVDLHIIKGAQVSRSTGRRIHDCYIYLFEQELCHHHIGW